MYQKKEVEAFLKMTAKRQKRTQTRRVALWSMGVNVIDLRGLRKAQRASFLACLLAKKNNLKALPLKVVMKCQNTLTMYLFRR